MMIIMLMDLGEDVIFIRSCMFVTLPCVYRVASCLQVAFNNRLTK